jgi:hypothetical protein
MAEDTTADAAWEYAYLTVPSNLHEDLVRALNNLGVEGWQLVTTDINRPIRGLQALAATVRRQIEPLPPPPTLAEDWYPDPSGRFDKRYWNGRSWTFHVGRSADKSTHRDPPTRRTPTPDLKQ